jgi:Cu2+-exporting ATPase
MPVISDFDTANLRIDIKGMRCAGCVAAIERELRQNNQFAGVSVDLLTEQAIIAIDPQLNRAELAQQAIAVIAKAGFQGQIAQSAAVESSDNSAQFWQIGKCVLLIGLALAGHGWHWEHNSALLHQYWIWSTVLLVSAGWEVWKDGLLAFGRGAPNMNSLVTLGALGSYISSAIAVLKPEWGWHSYLSEVLFLLGFVLLGQVILDWAKANTAREIKALLKRQPQIAHKITDNGTVDIPAIAVQIGDRLLVKAGEAIPTDGIVLEGTTAVDEAMLTGESMPVTKSEGDRVFGATLNLTNRLVMTASHLAVDTVFSKIVSLVQRAQMSKAPIHSLVDRVSAYFVWGVLILALVTCLTWCHLLGAHDMLFGIQMAIAVLVVACPCALGLAMPTAITVGLGIGAKQGILIKGAEVLEVIPQVNAVVFDKTGTLTQGKPQVCDIVPYGDIAAEDLLQWCASAESAEGHILAQAIVQEAIARNLEVIPIHTSQTYPGCGITAQLINHQDIQLGTEAWLGERVAIPPECSQLAEELAQQGKTPIFVACSGEYAGLLALRDQPKPQAKLVIDKLARMGLQVYLLTGDRQTTAHVIARELGINPDQVIAEVKPDGKAQAIKDLQLQGYKVAMVGDGINDAPALAVADVSIAMGSGMDVAIATADIVLLARHNDLEGVPCSLQLGKATFRKIYQNLYWAFAYNTLSLPIAAGALSFAGITLTPAIAALAMAGSSISVVLNSLSLKLAWR